MSRWILAALAWTSVSASVSAAPEAPSVRPERAPMAAPVPDTVLPVRPGDVLSVETWAGSLTVRVVDGDQVRFTADGGSGFPLARDGRTIRVGGERSGERDLLVELPSWMELRVHSRSLEVDVTGLAGPVSVQLLEGGIRLRRLTGGVRAQTMSGVIAAWELEGETVLSSMEGGVRVRGAVGSVRVESADGDVTLEDIRGSEVAAATVEGDVLFRGEIATGGLLSLTTHDGDVQAWLPADAGARVEVSTFEGSFTSDFPVRTRGFRAGESLRFTVGEGGARVVLQSFDGDITLHSR